MTAEELQAFAPLPSAETTYYRHVLCTYRDGHMLHSSTVRSSSCLGQSNDKGVCAECAKITVLLQRKHQRLHLGKGQHVLPRTPLQKVPKERLLVAFRNSRRSESKLRKEKDQIMKRLATECVPVTDTLHKSLKDVIKDEDITDPFLKMFWSEQRKAFERERERRYEVASNDGMICHFNTLPKFFCIQHPSGDWCVETARAWFEWGFYALSASKAIFRARTYNCITYSVR